MRLIENSLICQWLCRVWAVLAAAWPESWLYGALDRLATWAGKTARESWFCRWVGGEGILPAAWTGSLTYKVMNGLLNLPGSFCRWIYRVGRKLWDGSLFFGWLRKLGGAFYAVLGLFLAVMLVAPHALWNNLYAMAGAFLLFGLFVLTNASRPKVRLETRYLGPYFVLFLAMAACSFITSQSRNLSLRFVGFYLTLFLLVLLTVSAVRTAEQLQSLVGIAVFGLTVAVLYGCYQGVIGVEVVASQQDMSVNVGMPGRIYSFFDNPNNFAELLVMLLPLDFALFLNTKSRLGKGVWLLSCSLGLAALGLTLSRSGFLGLALAAVVFLAFENWKLIPVLVVLGICAIPLLPQPIYNRILTIGNTKDSSLNYRFSIYKASGRLMEDYWLKGVGLGGDVLTLTFKNYPPMFDGNYPLHTHNNYLQVWAEMGIFGLVAFIATLLGQLKNGIKAFRSATDKRLKRLLAGSVSGFCGILLISVAEYTWYYPRNMFFYWVLFAIIAACAKLAGSEKERANA